MRLAEFVKGMDPEVWARALLRDLRGILGNREAAGLAVATKELTTGTTTVVKTPSAVPGREVLISPRNSSAFNADAFALPISTPGSFTIQHVAGDPGRVVAWFIV